MNYAQTNSGFAAMLSASTINTLRTAGIQVTDGGAMSVDYGTFVHSYVHHTKLPVIAVAATLIDPVAAQLKFARVEMRTVVTKRWSMDSDEALALAEVAGADVRPPFWSQRDAYARIVRDVLGNHGLVPFFEDADGHDDLGRIRPRGYSTPDIGGDKAEFDAEVLKWQKEFRSLPRPRKILLATVIWLYAGDDNNLWMRKLPRRWLAVDAIAELRRAGMLRDWARVVAAYSGW